MSFKPVIFLAFANNKVDNAQYLRNLSLEQRGIRTALSEAVSKGLCEVIERSSSTISDIIDVFQDPIYGPRISIFHYGGHADGFSLLLESEDGSKALTHKEGLVPFFARQENLKLIFLNGCSSEGQATDLLKSGIPAVIGTTASINDEIATSLATRFYSSLGDGSSIEKAWADATDEVKIKNGTGNTRALYWPGKQEVNDRFPWVIQFKPGAEIIKEWNLPDISGNPLYGLPVIPQSYNLPESPFLYLNRYERKHAEVFFGRSYYVRSLFSSVADSQGPPIILLCGQSGTGKSSLLEAGLQPRLESGYEIIYLRRNGAIGLSATLFNALIEKCGFKPDVSVMTETKSFSELDNLKQFVANLSDSIKSELQPIIEKLSSSRKSNAPVTTVQDQKPSSLPVAWHLVEQKLGKPLLVILDQLEEAYTRPNASLGNEMNQLFLDLKAVFGNPASLPKGKILLSYRKEYQPEIEEYCKKYELSRSKVFIEHISKNDIVELFQEFMSSPRLMSRYHLTVENGLPELIADDLAADKEAPVAPVLQILLTKMWKKAVDLHPEAPVFTHELYHELKEQGLAMDEFLQNQMQAIKKKLPEAHDLGFVLDMLAFHCTANNTSAARTEKELLAHYPFAIDSAKKVLAACKDSFLITDLGGNEHSSMLAHDTLAKSVVKAQQRSTQPIQQGKRILSSRIEAIKAGSEFATMDSWELKLIEKIQTYLPAFNEGEKKLFDSSRKEITKQERQRQRIVNSSRLIVVMAILSGIVAWYLYAQSKKHEKASFVSLMTVSAGMNIEKDPTIAIRQALSGLQKDSNSLELKKMLLRAYYYSADNKLAWYNIIHKSNNRFTDLKYHNLTKYFIPIYEGESLYIFDIVGKITGSITTIKGKSASTKTTFKNIRWNKDGSNIIALDNRLRLYFFDKSGTLLKTTNDSGYRAFDYDGTLDRVVALRQTNQQGPTWADYYDIHGNKLDSLMITSGYVNRLRYSGNGKYLFYTEDDKSTIELIDLHGTRMFSKSGKGEIYCSPSGKLFGAILNRFQVGDNWYSKGAIWNLKGELVDSFTIAIHVDEFNFQVGNEARTTTDKLQINNLQFDHDTVFALTFGDDNLGKLSSLDNKLKYVLVGHTLPLTSIEMDNEQSTAITSSFDGTIRLWDLQIFKNLDYNQYGDVRSWIQDPSGNFLFVYNDTLGQRYNISSNTDSTWRIRYPRSNYKWYFLDSTHLVGYSSRSHDLNLFKPNVDSLIHLSKNRSSIKPNYTVGLLNNKLIVVDDNSIHFFDIDGIFLKSIRFDRGYVLGSCFSYDKSLLAIATTMGGRTVIAIYNQDGIKIKESKSQIDGDSISNFLRNARINGDQRFDNYSFIKFSNNSNKILSYDSDGSIEIFNLKSGTDTFVKRQDCAGYVKGPWILNYNFSPDDTRFLSSSSDGLIRLLDSTGNLINSFQSDMTALKDAAFTPDGKLIYSYDADTTLNLWDLQGNLIYTYNGHNAYFTPDGNRLYTIKNHKNKDSELRDYLTPQGAYNYFKSNKTFQKPIDNSLYGRWLRLLEKFGLN